jgi:hypothetical protein
MQPPPKGDPEFSILGPTNNEILGPNFSVYGWGPQNTANVVAYVGGLQCNAALQPHPNLSATNWEAIFTGVASESYVIRVTSSVGTAPAPPNTISVTVDANPGITIANPTPPMPMAVGDPATNPWDGWQVTGTYDTAKINRVVIYLTRRGISFWGGRGRIEQVATLDTSNGRWSCKLDFMSANDRGKGFLIHYLATRIGGGIVHGSIANFFDGPSADNDE